MTFATEVVKRDARPIVCVEIILDSGTLYYSDVALPEADKCWEPRVLSVGSVNRAIAPDQGKLIINNVSISLDNNDPDDATGEGHFGPLLDEDFEGKSVNIYLKFKESDGTIVSQKVFSGLCSPTGMTATEFDIEARPAIAESVGILQRSVNVSAYANAPESSIGQGLNIILGKVSSANGAVFCPCIDGTNRYFVVAQHAVKAIDDVYRERAGAITKLTLTTHYTVTKSATDGEGNTYAYVTILAGSYQAGDKFYADVQGLEDNGDGTGVLYENPAEAVEAMITGFTGLTGSDLDSTSWTAAATECTSRGYDTSGYFGCCIPESGGQVESSNDQWSLLQSICKGFNHTLYITVDGLVGITSVDTSELSDSTTLIHYEERNGDFTADGITVDFQPLELDNEVRCLYQQVHSVQSGYENYIRGYNDVSQSNYGLKEAQCSNRVAQDATLAKDVLQREMQMASGRMRKIRWTIPGLWGLQSGSDVGDIVEISHTRAIGTWAQRQVKIISISVQLTGSPTVTLEALPMGSDFFTGSIAFSTEETLGIVAEIDTWVKQGDPTTSYGTDTTLWHGRNPYSASGDYYRAAYRFDLTALAAATIQSASLQLYVTQAFNGSQIQLRQLMSTAWDESSTFNAFDGGVWTEANIGGTQLAPYVGSGTGYKTFVLNSDGITYLNSVLGGTNLVQFTHQSMNSDENYVIATRESATASQRPTLTVVYTA